MTVAPPSTPAVEATPDAHRARRRWLLGGLAGAAALAGGGLAWWHDKGTRASAPDRVDALWGLSFDTPSGGSLGMQTLRGRPLVINFWATWCPPCVEELPLLDRFFRENSVKGWQVIGLAIDQPSSVRKFLDRTPVSFPVGLAGLGGTELGLALGNLGGGLPFTVVVAASGEILQRKIGRLAPEDVGRWTQLG
ncbi:MAG: TlpA disulfide reductase family protein [Pseudomonadota bacterium]